MVKQEAQLQTNRMMIRVTDYVCISETYSIK